MTLRIVSYNIRFGGHRRRSAIAEVLGHADGDLVVLQEATNLGVASWLADVLDLRVVAAERGRSVAVLARVAVDDFRWHHPGRGRSFVELRLEERRLRVLGAHLSAGLSMRGERRRRREVAGLLGVTQGDEAPDMDTVIVGDLNAIAPGDESRVGRLPAWIRLLLRFDGGIRTEAIAGLLEAGYVDGYRAVHPDDAGATMPAVDPSVRLDYILVSEAAIGRLRDCSITTVNRALLVRASDHLPLIATLDG